MTTRGMKRAQCPRGGRTRLLTPPGIGFVVANLKTAKVLVTIGATVAARRGSQHTRFRCISKVARSARRRIIPYSCGWTLARATGNKCRTREINHTTRVDVKHVEMESVCVPFSKEILIIDHFRCDVPCALLTNVFRGVYSIHIWFGLMSNSLPNQETFDLYLLASSRVVGWFWDFRECSQALKQKNSILLLYCWGTEMRNWSLQTSITWHLCLLPWYSNKYTCLLSWVSIDNSTWWYCTISIQEFSSSPTLTQAEATIVCILNNL